MITEAKSHIEWSYHQSDWCHHDCERGLGRRAECRYYVVLCHTVFGESHKFCQNRRLSVDQGNPPNRAEYSTSREWTNLCFIIIGCEIKLSRLTTKTFPFYKVIWLNKLDKKTLLRRSWKIKSGYIVTVPIWLATHFSRFFQHQEVQLLLILTSTLWYLLSHLEKVRINCCTTIHMAWLLQRI